MPIDNIDFKEKQGRLLQESLEIELSPKHKLYKLRSLINWTSLESQMSELCQVSNTGRTRKSLRVLLGVTMLQAMYNYSDCLSSETLMENLYWQYFCGYEYGRSDLLVSESCIRRFRQEIGEEGFKLILQELALVGIKVGAYKKKDLDSVIIDTTVQSKNIKHPHDVPLLSKAREELVKLSYDLGISLNDTYAKKYKRFAIKVWKYKQGSKSKQRLKLMKHMKTLLGRLIRVIERNIASINKPLSEKHSSLLSRIKLIHSQSCLNEKQRKDYKEENKVLYSLHATEVECIGKGKLHKPYEFGNKVGLAVSGQGNFILGVKSFHGNPYDGHTLKQTVESIKEIAGVEPKKIFVDLGYRGSNYSKKGRVYTPYTKKEITPEIKRMQKRRSAIEPVIGHLKHYGRMGRNYLKGVEGDILNPLISAIGFNLKRLANVVTAT